VLLATLRYCAFALLAVAGPGVAVQRLLGVAVVPALVLPAGLAVTAGAAWLAGATGQPWILPAICLLLDLSLARPRRGRSASGGPAPWAVVPALAAVVTVLALTRYPWNRETGQGDFRLDPFYVVDTAFHVGLTWELVSGGPPQVPGLSGVPLHYHVGADVVRAASLRWANVLPYDAITRYEPTLLALALMLSLHGLAACLGGGRLALLLVPWTVLAGDFSFVLAAFPGTSFWTEYLKGNILASLVVANSSVAALAVALAAVIALDRHRRGDGRGYLVIASGLALAVPFFKVFLAPQLLAGLVLAAALDPRARRAAAAMAGACLATTAALVLVHGRGTVEVTLEPLDLLGEAVRKLALPLRTPEQWVALGLLWLLLSLGLRLLGILPALRGLRSRSAPVITAAVLALIGWPMGLLFRIALREDPTFNEAFYFIEHSGVVLWVFTVLALEGLVARAGRPVLAPAAIAVAALSLPTTLEFVHSRRRMPEVKVPAAVMRAMRALAADGAPGDVVMARPHPRFPPPPIVFTGRRVPYSRVIIYLEQFASASFLRDRFATVQRFFRTEDPREAAAIARALHARHVFLFATDQMAADPAGWLRLVYEEPRVKLYRVEGVESAGR
jgi:hypothetical protein